MSRASYRETARTVTVQEQPHRGAGALPDVTRPMFLPAKSPRNLERQRESKLYRPNQCTRHQPDAPKSPQRACPPWCGGRHSRKDPSELTLGGGGSSSIWARSSVEAPRARAKTKGTSRANHPPWTCAGSPRDVPRPIISAICVAPLTGRLRPDRSSGLLVLLIQSVLTNCCLIFRSPTPQSVVAREL